MLDASRKELAAYRLQCAEECLQDAKACSGKGAANRSYYAIFNAMRAVLALDGVDFGKHSAVISYFRKVYIKTGVLPRNCSKTIDDLFRIRQKSDYDDFYLISKEEVEKQITAAEAFIGQIKIYLTSAPQNAD